MAFRARTAVASSAAATPTTSPRITTTPGMASAAEVSSVASLVPCGSAEHLAVPQAGPLDVGRVAMPARDQRPPGALGLRHRMAGHGPAVGGLPARGRSRSSRSRRRGSVRRSRSTGPTTRASPGRQPRPAPPGRPSTARPPDRPASRLAAAAALCRSGMFAEVERLAKVPMSNGTWDVSPITMQTDSNGTRNSSATACASDVRTVPGPARPCP